MSDRPPLPAPPGVSVAVSEVTCCGDCPFGAPRLDGNAIARGLECNLLGEPVGPELPPHCPLRRETRIVQLKKEAR